MCSCRFKPKNVMWVGMYLWRYMVGVPKKKEFLENVSYTIAIPLVTIVICPLIFLVVLGLSIIFLFLLLPISKNHFLLTSLSNYQLFLGFQYFRQSSAGV